MDIRLLRLGVGLVAAGGFVSAALAQGDSPLLHEQVIVTAPRLSNQVEAIAHDFVVHYAAPAVLSGELTRWNQPICPRTDGLSRDEYTSFVTQRIRVVAAMAGVKVAPTPCKPNIEILFTDKPQETLDRVHAKNVDLLGYKGVTVDSHPIQSWYMTGTVDLDGKVNVDHEVYPDIEFHGGVGTGKTAAGGTLTWTIPTAHVNGYRLKTDIRSEFINVLIIADTNKTINYQLGPIADYLAVMALSKTAAFESCQAMPSITNLMAADCDAGRKTDGLTDGDLGYLRGVYKMSPDEPLGVQQSEIAMEMKDELTGR